MMRARVSCRLQATREARATYGGGRKHDGTPRGAPGPARVARRTFPCFFTLSDLHPLALVSVSHNEAVISWYDQIVDLDPDSYSDDDYGMY